MSIARTLTDPRVRTGCFALLACAGALASRYAVPFAFRYSMSFLPLMVAVLLFLLYRFQWDRVAKASQASLRLTITCAITALLFATFLVIGSWSICEDAGGLSWIHAVATIVNAFPLYVLVVLLMGWLDQCAARIQKRTQQRTFRLTLKGCAIVFAVLLLCWLPIFLAAFPGFFTCDMTTGEYAEFNQYLSGNYSDEYPFIHVMLLGTLITFGESLTGSFNGGVAFFIVLQMLFMSAIFTYVVRVIANATASRTWTALTVAYLALDPVISIFVVCTTRDTPFTAFAVLLAALLFLYFRNQPHPRPRKGTRSVPFPTIQPDATSRADSVGKGTASVPFLGNGSNNVALLVAIALCAVAFCFFRPNGIIVFVILIPFLILCERGAKARTRMGAVCAAVLVVCWLWFVPLAGAFGVQPSTTARLLVFSLPAQQITNVVNSDAATLTELDDLNESGYGYPNEEGEIVSVRRAPELADIARHNLQSMSTDDILRFYFTLGINHPWEYFEAFVDQTQAAWNPYAYGQIYHAGVYEGSETSVFSFSWDDPAYSQTLAPGILEGLKAVSRTLDVQNVPLLSLLLSLPFYLWTLLLLVARSIITLDRRIITPCVLFAGIALTVFVGPCEQFRYYLPLLCGLPLMLLCLTASHRERRA